LVCLYAPLCCASLLRMYRLNNLIWGGVGARQLGLRVSEQRNNAPSCLVPIFDLFRVKITIMYDNQRRALSQ
jgi:hypothetical protein